SSDTNGYMMVVNASFEPGLFYEQIITGLCEDVLYEFSADIFNLNKSSATDRIQANVSFLLDGREMYTTGDIPRNEMWNTYGFIFKTAPGQTELKLSLRNNAPGGIGNDLALDNITFRPCGSTALILPETVANICEDGEPIDLFATIIGSAFKNKFIQWQQSFDAGVTWFNLKNETDSTYTFDNLQSGFYYYRYLLADSEEKLNNEKCRTFSNTKVIRVIPKFVDVVDSICQGMSFSFKGGNIFSPGVYIDTLQNVIRCDSIVTVNLSVVENDLKGSFRVFNPTCDYIADGSINLYSLTSQGPYEVKINGETKGPPWRIDGLSPGQYQYKIRDKYGCNTDTLLSIINPPKFVVDLGPDRTLFLGQKFRVDNFVNQRAAIYEWTPRSINCKPPCDSISELFIESVSVSLKATSIKRCEASDEVQVSIGQVQDPIIPNVFTPNGDGINDYFSIFPNKINAIELINELTIYNRNGKPVFEKKLFQPGIPELGWDGTANGNKAPFGVYYYSASVSFINGNSSFFSGFIQLLR
ncbi:MAG: gliding motility-associated C-terminal domain-containing protein, partial [Bacteroidota bacterium]